MIEGKVIQIQATDNWVIALCSDGTIWRKDVRSGPSVENWTRFG